MILGAKKRWVRRKDVPLVSFKSWDNCAGLMRIFLHGSQHNICLRATSSLARFSFFYSENCFLIVLIANLGIYANYSPAVWFKDNRQSRWSRWSRQRQPVVWWGLLRWAHRCTQGRWWTGDGGRPCSWPPAGEGCTWFLHQLPVFLSLWHSGKQQLSTLSRSTC